MNIAVLGGAGDVGSRAVEDLAVAPGVNRVTILDRDLAVAEHIASTLASASAEVIPRKIDASNHREVVDALRGHDVAASAVGPFFRFEAPLVEAAIEAGVDYCSVCDEWDAMDMVFDRFAVKAREAGRVVLTGLGTSPGITNVAIRHFADELDSIDRADVYVYQPLDAGGGEAVVRHMLHIMTGKVAAWRGGRRVDIEACSESRDISFPIYGNVRCWNMGHAEPITIPKFIGGIDEVNFFMGYGKGARAFVLPARLGLFRSRSFVDGFIGMLMKLGSLMEDDSEPAEGAVRVDIWGRKGGVQVHQMACGVGGMRKATGVSMAVGALMLGEGKLTTRGGGVFAPEACLEPARFMELMQEKGLVAYRDLAMTRLLEP